MKIVILGPAHPYRGGLASIMHTMAREYQRRGHEVKIYTFTVQYPSLLFPGKTQYTDSPAPEDLHIERVVNTVNPINWIRLGYRLKRECPDMILMKYWTPFMAPCFGTVLRDHSMFRANPTDRACINPGHDHPSHCAHHRRNQTTYLHLRSRAHAERRVQVLPPGCLCPQLSRSQ